MVPNLFLLDNEAKQWPWKTETFQKNQQLLVSFCVAEIHFLLLLFLESDRSRIIKKLNCFCFWQRCNIVNLFLKVFRLLLWNGKVSNIVLFMIQLLLLYHKVMWCQDKKGRISENCSCYLKQHSVHVGEKCSVLNYIYHIFYTWKWTSKT